MALDRYAEYLPTMLDWIQGTLEAHAANARLVAPFGFPRLPRHFSKGLLTGTSVVITDHIPVPPLSAWGLREFASFETQHMSGITYLDTYFLLPSAADEESLHFHELVHIIQWDVLGPKDFLLLYAAGLVEHGYENSPLEMMASGHQRRFDFNWPLYSVEAEVRKQTLALLEGRNDRNPG
jgi:hypothetical protein